MQNNPNSNLPKWLILAIIGIFCLHFFILVVNQFSRQILPRSLFYLTSNYTQPWFLQNLTAFAPDPPDHRNVLVYRIHSDGNWNRWQYPARKYLQRQYQNRFDVAIKIHDQMEQVANNLRTSAALSPGKELFGTDRWDKLPIVDAVQRIVKMEEGDKSIDSLQIGLYIEEVKSDGNEIQYKDSAMVLPKHKWVEF